MKQNYTVSRWLVLILGVASCTPLLPLGAAPAPAGQAAATAAALDNQRFSGKVIETMNAAGYTYVRVDTGKAKYWAAAPQFPVKVGDTITIEDGMAMRNYHSKTLKRDFDLVYFTGRALVNGAQANASAAALPQGHPPLTGQTTAPGAQLDFAGLKKAEGGKTIQEIYAQKTKLAGQPVKVRGKVVKYNHQIMGKNWIHLRDGSGTEGSNDLTLTTQSQAKVGDTVVATGKIVLDKDFGHGYKYGIIMEDAKLTVEPAIARK